MISTSSPLTHPTKTCRAAEGATRSRRVLQQSSRQPRANPTTTSESAGDSSGFASPSSAFLGSAYSVSCCRGDRHRDITSVRGQPRIGSEEAHIVVGILIRRLFVKDDEACISPDGSAQTSDRCSDLTIRNRPVSGIACDDNLTIRPEIHRARAAARCG